MSQPTLKLNVPSSARFLIVSVLVNGCKVEGRLLVDVLPGSTVEVGGEFLGLPQAVPAPAPDGPDEKSLSFRWRGKAAKFSKEQFELFAYVWRQIDHIAARTEALKVVGDRSPLALRKLVQRINEALEQAKIHEVNISSEGGHSLQIGVTQQ